MRIKAAWLLMLLCPVLLAGVLTSSTRAQGEVRVFGETQHTLSGEFLSFYQSNPDALLDYGFPITEEFIDNMGKRVQYFQKARFEYDPSAPVGQRVKLTDLGKLILQPAKLVPLNDFSTNTPACSQYRTFFVCYAFLDFLNKHGGITQFGYPLTNYVREGDLYVQYFERARFEYHPGSYTGNLVTLTEIGRLQFLVSGNDPRYLDAPASSSIPNVITRLHVEAFVGRAVIETPNTQSLYVVVLSQSSQPVYGAAVKAFVRLPDGHEQSYGLPATDSDGLSQLKFDVGQQLPNLVNLIRVEVTYGGLKGTTTSWFRTWW